jgi:hypothetical protein
MSWPFDRIGEFKAKLASFGIGREHAAVGAHDLVNDRQSEASP